VSFPWELLTLDEEPALESFLGYHIIGKRSPQHAVLRAQHAGGNSTCRLGVVFHSRKAAGEETWDDFLRVDRAAGDSLFRRLEIHELQELDRKSIQDGRSKFLAFLHAEHTIKHFACPCELTGTSSVGTEFIVESKFRVPIHSMLERLKSDLSSRVVFLNVCGGGVSRMRPNDSVAAAMLDHGALLVLASTARVPGPSAAQFARTFYENLLNGASAYESIVRARDFYFAQGHCFPLIYGYFGQPDFFLDAARLPPTHSSIHEKSGPGTATTTPAAAAKEAV
jgi:hypothetical protein